MLALFARARTETDCFRAPLMCSGDELATPPAEPKSKKWPELRGMAVELGIDENDARAFVLRMEKKLGESHRGEGVRLYGIGSEAWGIV